MNVGSAGDDENAKWMSPSYWAVSAQSRLFENWYQQHKMWLLFCYCHYQTSVEKQSFIRTIGEHHGSWKHYLWGWAYFSICTVRGFHCVSISNSEDRFITWSVIAFASINILDICWPNVTNLSHMLGRQTHPSKTIAFIASISFRRIGKSVWKIPTTITACTFTLCRFTVIHLLLILWFVVSLRIEIWCFRILRHITNRRMFVLMIIIFYFVHCNYFHGNSLFAPAICYKQQAPSNM